MLSLVQPLIVPTNGPVEIRTFKRSQVTNIPDHVAVASANLASFARSISDRRIIGLGEANHGTGDFYTYRGRLSMELARTGKLRCILLEVDAIGMLAIDDYVVGANIDLPRAVAALRFWITDIQEFLQFLADVRTHNAAAASTEAVHVLGIDAQRVEPPVQLLLAHQVSLAISDHEAELLGRIAPEHGAAFTKLSAVDRSTLLSLLGRLATPNGQVELKSDRGRGAIAARSIQYQLGYIENSGTVVLRDQAMAGLATYIAKLSGAEQTAVWGHNGHIARQPDGVDKSLGQYLSEQLGEAYFPIAFLSFRGNARAWDAPGKVGVIPHVLAPPPPYNLESVVMKSTKFLDIAWVRLDRATGALKQWLTTPKFVREFGSAFDAADTQTLRPFPEAFAGVVVIQHATASTPTPTGVRKVGP